MFVACVLLYSSGLIFGNLSLTFTGKNNGLTLAGRVKSFFSQAGLTALDLHCTVYDIGQEWVTVTLGCIPTALVVSGE